MYHGNNVGHPLYPQTAGQNLTYIMSSLSTSLEPKSQLTIKPWPRMRMSILALGRKQRKENSQSRLEESEKKGRKKNSRSKIRRKQKEIYRKVFGPDNIWTKQNCHQVKKEKKPRPKVVLSLWLPTKILCIKQKQKRTVWVLYTISDLFSA